MKKTVTFLFMSIFLTACSDWETDVRHYNFEWSDKGDVFTYTQITSSSRIYRIMPLPGGEKKEKSVIKFVDRDLNELRSITLYEQRGYDNPIIDFLYFSEFENYIVIRTRDDKGSWFDGKYKIEDLEGKQLYQTSFTTQTRCRAKATGFGVSVSTLIPSPDGRFIFEVNQTEDCNLEIEVLDVRDDFSLQATYELPVSSPVTIAWSEDGNIIAQTISSEEDAQQFSWKLYLDGRIENYDEKKFSDECFTPPTASHYVSRDLKLGYIDFATGEIEPEIIDLIEQEAEIISRNDLFFYSGFPSLRLNVFGCDAVG